MKLFITSVCAYMALVIYGVSVSANDGGMETQLAMPVAQWTVDKVYKENGFPTRECVMKAPFDNGMEISFKGKGKGLSALRIRDVSGDVASKVQGFVGLGLGKNSYGLQSRSMLGQVDLSLLSVPHVAEKIIAENTFRIKIGGEDYYFSALGFEQANDELLMCLGVKDLTTLKVVSDSVVLPRAPAVDFVMPSKPVDVVKVEPIDVMEPEDAQDNAPIDLLDNAPLLDDMAAELELNAIDEKRVDEPHAQWVAKKGDKIAFVLNEWGAKEGVDVAVQLDNNPSVTSDFAFDGAFADAVNRLINDNMDWVGTRPTAVLKDGVGGETQITGYKSDGGVFVNESDLVTAMPMQKYDPYRWRALQGTDLRKVLQQWAVRENVEFIWSAEQTFLIPQSMKSTTEFPEAVSELLGQFAEQPMRPVAKLNTDPQTGKVSLIVSSAK